jgi:Protein of unknown function (DUF4013)
MNYFQAYRYVFDSPKWMQNILFSMVCLFVPVVGAIVLLGYHYEIVEVMHLRGPQQYPDFDLKRLLNYLMRGLWVFLVALIVSLPIMALYVVFWLAMMITSISMQASGESSDAVGTTMLVLVAVFVPALFVASMIVNLLAIPLMLRAGLAQEFKAAFSWAFVRDFVGKMWVEMILSALFLAFTGTFLILAGMLACFVGMYPAAAYVSFAQPNLYHQLYELYLQRGGMAIPLKTEGVPL